MSSAVITRRSRPGRPRHIPAIDDRLSGREQILDAAARLFVDRGFAATSTREIAENVGIKQASIYYYFSTKDKILEELLALTVRPTLDQIDQIDRIEAVANEHGPAAALYALVMIDTGTLAQAPHNTGLLASLPEVRSLEQFKPYRAVHADLVDAYGRLGAQAAGHQVDGNLVAHLVESVVASRADGTDVDEDARHAIAAAALGACGATKDEIKIASAVAWAELIA